MTPAGFEPATPARKRPQTYALELAAIGDRTKNQPNQNILLNSYIKGPYSVCIQIYANGIPVVKRTNRYHRDLAHTQNFPPVSYKETNNLLSYHEIYWVS